MREQIDQLKEKWTALSKGADEIVRNADAEGRAMSEDEANRFNALMERHKVLGADIERREALLAAQQAETVSERKTTPASPGSQATSLIVPAGTRIEGYRRRKRMRAFIGERAEEHAYRSGMFLRATLLDDKKARNWCQDHGVEFRVQTEGVNTKGGFLVPDEFERAVINLREDYGVFRRECKVYPMSSDHVIIPRRTDGPSASFVGETTAITESEKTWDQVTLTAKKLGALTRMSSDLAEDAVIDLADDLADEMAYAFAAKEDACGFNGTGAAAYGGMTGILVKLFDTTTYAGSVYTAFTNHDQFSEYDAADLAGTMGKLPAYALPGAKWFCSQVAYSLVFERLSVGYGGATMREVEGGIKPFYMGYPIVISQSMPTSTADISGYIALLFGDLSQAATLGDRRGVTIKVDDSRYLEYDQIAVRATQRFDINVHNIGNATTAGSIIGLEAET